MEARKLSDEIHGEDEKDLAKALDALGYDEAAQYVYGMMYPEWKKRHAQKASDEQMEKFNESKPLWASHDKQLLAKRNEEIPGASSTATATAPSPPKTTPKSSLLSNVCCEDIDNIDNTKNASAVAVPAPQIPATTNAAFVPPELAEISFSLGILTVSDRAASGDYPEGDLSGPMVQEVVASILESSSNNNTKTKDIQTVIVPDEMDVIQKQLVDWTTTASLDLILTTGGTGFSSRDVTPEATSAILDKSCDGLMSFCSSSLTQIQPLAALSRGTAGIRGTTLICNLPGNPQAIREILPVLLPLALQAVADMKQ